MASFVTLFLSPLAVDDTLYAMSLSILVCDPTAQAASINEVLTVEGFDVTVSPETSQALSALKGNSWMLVIVSLDIPPLERAELLEALRGLHISPTIAFTGDAQSPDAKQLARSHGHAILATPVDNERLKLLAWQAAREAEEREAEMAVAAEVSGIDTQPGTMAAPDLDEVLARAAGAFGSSATDSAPPMGRSEKPKEGVEAAPVSAEDGRGLSTISSIVEQANEDLEGLLELKSRLTGAFELLLREEQTIKRLVDEKEKLVKKTNDIEASLNTQLEQFQSEATQMVDAVQAERDAALQAQKEAEAGLQEAMEQLAQSKSELDKTLNALESAKADKRESGDEIDAIKAKHQQDLATLEGEFTKRKEEMKAEATNAWSTLVYAVGSLVTGLPEAAVAINKTGAIIGASRTLAALMGTQANKIIGQPFAKVLSPGVQQLLQRAAEPFNEEGLEVEISPGAGMGTFHGIGYPLKSGKAGLRVLFLREPAGAGGGGGSGDYARPDGDVSGLIEDFKEKLFSIRLLTDTISTRAESEKIRAVAKDVTGEVDKLVGQVDAVFKA